jgi:hypothetical protein
MEVLQLCKGHPSLMNVMMYIRLLIDDSIWDRKVEE